jgi:hypothetical protein
VNPPQDKNTAMGQLLVLAVSLLTTYAALRATLDIGGG